MSTSGADERVVLQIDSRADVSGVRAMRTETTSLADAAVKASEQMTASEGKLAQAARAAATEQEKLVATLEQTRQARERAGGDFEKFKTELAAIVKAENSLAVATEETTRAIERQGKATVGTVQLGPAIPRVSGPTQLGPAGPGPSVIGQQLGPALPTTRLAAEAERSAAALERVDPKARSAGNALNMLAVSAATGTGSLAGLTIAAGNVAQGIAAMSDNAKLAASSAGIGALTAAVGVLIALSVDAARRVKEIPEGKLAATADAHLKNLHEQSQVGDELARLDARRQALAEGTLTTWGKIKALANSGDLGVLAREQERLQAIVNLDAQRTATLERQRQIEEESHARALRGLAINAEAQTTATSRYAARLRVIEAERLEVIRTHELTQSAAEQRAATLRRQLARDSSDYAISLSGQAALAEIALTETVTTQRLEAERIRYAEEKKALQDRASSADDYRAQLDEVERKHTAIATLIRQQSALAIAASEAARASESDDPRESFEGKVAAIRVQQQADAQRLGAKEAEAIAEQKIQKLERQRRDEGLAGYAKLAGAVRGHGALVTAMSKAAADAVRLHDIAVAGKRAAISAQMEWAAAQASFATGNVVGGGLHLLAAGGYAAAALAAGAEAAGVVSGGGGASGNAGGAGAGNSSTFQPRTGEAGGDITVILQGVHISSREVVDEARYQINRAGNLKRPIPIAASVGFAGRA